MKLYDVMINIERVGPRWSDNGWRVINRYYIELEDVTVSVDYLRRTELIRRLQGRFVLTDAGYEVLYLMVQQELMQCPIS